MMNFFKKEMPIEAEKEMPAETEEKWIWVEGYKGTDSNMRCRDFQYELGKQFDKDPPEEIVICHNGFHFCPYIEQVFSFYPRGRIFKVKALVRSSEWVWTDRSNVFGVYINSEYCNKQVAKSIIFLEEINFIDFPTAIKYRYPLVKTHEDYLKFIETMEKNPNFTERDYYQSIWIEEISKYVGTNLGNILFNDIQRVKVFEQFSFLDFVKAIYEQNDISSDMKLYLIMNRLYKIQSGNY